MLTIFPVEDENLLSTTYRICLKVLWLMHIHTPADKPNWISLLKKEVQPQTEILDCVFIELSIGRIPIIILQQQHKLSA